MRPALSLTTLAILVLLLSACAGPAHRADSGSPAENGNDASASRNSEQMPPPDHVWRSDGYRWVVTLTGDRARTYDITAISCIAHRGLDQIGQPGPDGAVTYGRDGVARQTLRQGPNGHATLHLLGTAADVDLVPLPALPESCTRDLPNDPLVNFDVFWQTFAENYNSFQRKNINWDAVRAQYRPMVTDDTDPKQLYQILTEMIRPLGDAHTSIDGPEGKSFSGKRPGTRDEDQVSRQQADSAVDNHLKQDLGVTNIQTFANNRIAYADLPDGRGYLRITAFEGYRGNNTPYEDSRQELQRVLDTVITQQRVSSWRGLIIDVRFNTGGDDALGLQIASRLTDSPYVAYTKQPRNNPTDPSRHGRLQTVTVQPADGPRYTGPVSVLTSDLTVSAGETFVEALMGRTPAPRRIGATTQGVFADNMQRKLPNGWTFGLGNEEYYAPNGQDYEGLGIPPDVNTPVFTDDEVKQNRDSALDAALAGTSP